jgi:hypothetical protein
MDIMKKIYHSTKGTLSGAPGTFEILIHLETVCTCKARPIRAYSTAF